MYGRTDGRHLRPTNVMRSTRRSGLNKSAKVDYYPFILPNYFLEQPENTHFDQTSNIYILL